MDSKASAQEALNRNQAAQSYGGAAGFGDSGGAHSNTVFAPGKRRRINVIAIVFNTFFPFIMFATLYCCLSFRFHYKNPAACWVMVAVFIAVCGVLYSLAWRHRQKDRSPMWLTFTSISCIFAVTMSVIFGNLNYVYNLLPYYEINSLNTYPSVNPAVDFGQMLMDAGRIYFADGAALDMKKAMSFKATDLYCVVPIVTGSEKLSHYDFWAVGTNCCSSVSADFRCGQFNNPKARSGLRLVSDSERPYYRLAVQMAEAQFNLNAPHPLFFDWIQDPMTELNAYLDAGWRYFMLGVSCHFAFNLFCTASATIVFSKIGYM